jgi:hypothetical protein
MSKKNDRFFHTLWGFDNVKKYLLLNEFNVKEMKLFIKKQKD